MTAVLRLREAAFGYTDRAVVEHVSLTVQPGEALAVLGANGSGKSTLVKGVLGLNTRLAGEVELFGVPQARFRDRARIGYVPQRHTLSASVRATVSEVVAIGRLPHQSWWVRPTRLDRDIIAESLELVGLADRHDQEVSRLSGGQQRRVLIARALAAQPDVLLLDEPTAGVDLASQRVLANVLARLAARDTTMLIVTHELAALRDVVGRIVVMTAGRIAFDGAPEELALRDHAGTPLLVPHDHGFHHDAEARPDDSPAAGPLDGAAGAGWRRRLPRRTGAPAGAGWRRRLPRRTGAPRA
ncbi:MAG TPA: metal ABC transporter ATP-binding protein [Dermatophilaceae bacterium]|nr:metal ABC transporter ATP-binding protein [Dermatophilaceae bacterium]